MEALNSLYRDHRTILRVLEALEHFADAIERGGGDQREELARFNTFFRDYVGLNHHDKEESVLMPVLEAHGFHWSDGVLERFREEHEHENYLLRSLQQAAERSSPWSGYERRSLVELLRQIVAFAKNHIKHENVELLLAATKRLPPDVLAQLDSALARFRDEQMGADNESRLLTLASELAERYGVPLSGSEAPAS